MKTNGLTTEKVVARCETAGDLERKFTAVCVDSIRCPLAVAEKTILVDLEPFQTSDGGGLRVSDLSQVDKLRARVSASVPLDGGCGAGSNIEDAGSWGGTIDVTDLYYLLVGCKLSKGV